MNILLNHTSSSIYAHETAKIPRDCNDRMCDLITLPCLIYMGDALSQTTLQGRGWRSKEAPRNLKSDARAWLA
jgi:hypothetical protein